MKLVVNTLTKHQITGDFFGHCQWLEHYLGNDHQLVTTDCEQIFYQNLESANIAVTTSWHSARLTEEVLHKATDLKLIIVAGPCHKHIDVETVLERQITMVKMPYTSVRHYSEIQLLHILRALNLQKQSLVGKTIGLIGAGYTAANLVKMLQPFDVQIRYFDQHQWEPEEEEQYHMQWFPTVEMTVENCDIVVSNCPLEYGGILVTENLFSQGLIGKMKSGVILLVSSHPDTINKHDVNKALDSEHISMFIGPDTLNQPTKNYQTELANHTKSILDRWFAQEELPQAWILTEKGQRVLVPGCACFNLAGWHA